VAKDILRIRILKLLREQEPLSAAQIFSVIVDDGLRDVTESEVHGTLIELSFEGLVKIVHEPMCSITEAGRHS
jgi:repressor of nif and glnA expression